MWWYPFKGWWYGEGPNYQALLLLVAMVSGKKHPSDLPLPPKCLHIFFLDPTLVGVEGSDAVTFAQRMGTGRHRQVAKTEQGFLSFNQP